MGKQIKIALLIGMLALFSMAPPAYSFRTERSARDYDYNNASAERQIARLRHIMQPLLQVTDRRMSIDDVRISIVDDQAINAASAGDGKYYVTRALLNQATDEELRGVLAHEIAHEDLGHPAKAQLLGAGVGIGVSLLEQFFPGSSAVTPLAGSLITNGYTRPMELEADRHAVTLLERAGYSKQTMIDTLTWLERQDGDGGGILSSHPATSERIQALRALH
jgi:predicted Zn-dependent protease